METADAAALISEAVAGRPGTWADLGAGDGTFTRALVGLLGATSRIYAVDRNARALASLGRWARAEGANVTTVVADFARPFALPGVDPPGLDGMLLANALHFVPDQDAVLARLATWLKASGRMVLVEYDRHRASRWVPFPLPIEHLTELVAATKLSAPVVTATRPSAFGGSLYVAVATRGDG